MDDAAQKDAERAVALLKAYGEPGPLVYVDGIRKLEHIHYQWASGGAIIFHTPIQRDEAVLMRRGEDVYVFYCERETSKILCADWREI